MNDLGNELAGDALNAFMDWWSAHPALSGVEAKVQYFPLLLVEANQLRAKSTSARLRQVQADLAASQADLTKAEQRLIATGGERDRAVEALRVAERSHAIRVQALEAELASARQELAQLRAAHCPDPANRG